MRGGAHGLRKFIEFLRNVFARETLDAAPEDPPRSRRARTLARALFAIEELPEDPPTPPRARWRDALRALAASEALPPEPPAAPPIVGGEAPSVMSASVRPAPGPRARIRRVRARDAPSGSAGVVLDLCQ